MPKIQLKILIHAKSVLNFTEEKQEFILEGDYSDKRDKIDFPKLSFDIERTLNDGLPGLRFHVSIEDS